MPKITQVNGLGRMGQQRGNEQIRRKDAIASHFKTITLTKSLRSSTLKVMNQTVFGGATHADLMPFIDADTLIVIGTPCRNIAALKAEYSVLTGLHPDSEDRGLTVHG
jgi:hypothetical protein